MELSDKEMFSAILKTVWLMCCDPLSDTRQRGYWWALKEECTLEEFEYAARKVLARALYHKMPMPGTFLAEVHQQRAARERAGRLAAQAANDTALVRAETAYQDMQADPVARALYDQQ